jgi:copper chaperone
MNSVELKIEGMSCNHCVMAVQKELSNIPVESFEVQIGSAKIEYNEEKINLEKIENAINEAGFKVRKN